VCPLVVGTLLMRILRVLLRSGSFPLQISLEIANASSQLCLCSYAFSLSCFSLYCASLIWVRVRVRVREGRQTTIIIHDISLKIFPKAKL